MNKSQIEFISIKDLTPYNRNSRTHSTEQVSQIAASITEFGFTNPVLIDAEGGIIAGHGRVMAAEHLGMGNVPCLRLSYLSEAQKRAYIIADNKLAMNAGWDESVLAIELGELEDLGFDLELTGFSQDEMQRINNPVDNYPESSAKEIDPDDYQMGHTCPKCGFEFDAKA